MRKTKFIPYFFLLLLFFSSLLSFLFSLLLCFECEFHLCLALTQWTEANEWYRFVFSIFMKSSLLRFWNRGCVYSLLLFLLDLSTFLGMSSLSSLSNSSVSRCFLVEMKRVEKDKKYSSFLFCHVFKHLFSLQVFIITIRKRRWRTHECKFLKKWNWSWIEDSCG